MFRIHQDILDFDHLVGEEAKVILRILGSYTAFKLPSGTWTWDFHYGVCFDKLWLKSDKIDQIEKFEIDNRIHDIIAQRVESMDLSGKIQEKEKS